jgi:hypothetical protein
VTAALKQRGFNPEAMVISDTIGSSSLNAVNATIGSAIDQPGETKNIDFLSNGLEFNCIATAIKNWGKDDPRTFVAVEKCTVSTSGSSLVEIVVQKIGNEIR